MECFCQYKINCLETLHNWRNPNNSLKMDGCTMWASCCLPDRRLCRLGEIAGAAYVLCMPFSTESYQQLLQELKRVLPSTALWVSTMVVFGMSWGHNNSAIMIREEVEVVVFFVIEWFSVQYDIWHAWSVRDLPGWKLHYQNTQTQQETKEQQLLPAAVRLFRVRMQTSYCSI